MPKTKQSKSKRVAWLCLVCCKSWWGTEDQPPEILVKWKKEMKNGDKFRGMCVDCAMWSE